jgi:hypothetical protein
MKDLHGRASTGVAAPLERCRALLEAVDSYPMWYPEAVRDVEVLERDARGRATRARAKLHLARGPLVKDFDLVLAVVVEPPATIRLTRVADAGGSRFGVTWRLREDGGTHIDLELTATISVPRLVPLGGIGDAIAEGFIGAATRALDAPSAALRP